VCAFNNLAAILALAQRFFDSVGRRTSARSCDGARKAGDEARASSRWGFSVFG
jgi:hypothetical protein